MLSRRTRICCKCQTRGRYWHCDRASVYGPRGARKMDRSAGVELSADLGQRATTDACIGSCVTAGRVNKKDCAVPGTNGLDLATRHLVLAAVGRQQMCKLQEG